MSPAWIPRRRRALGVLLAVIVGASACAVEQGEITIETVDLASGEYYGLTWGGTQVERFHVLARRGSPEGDVMLWSPNRDEPCSMGQLSNYAPLQPMNGGEFVLGSPSPARIAVFDPPVEGGGSNLAFFDLDCQRISFGVEDALQRSLLRLYEPDLMDLRWVVGTVDGTLLFVDPWAQTKSIVARDVAKVQPFQNGLWLIEGGRVVRRDLEGKEIAGHGRGVTEALPIGRDGDLVYVDERGLVLYLAGVETVIEEEDDEDDVQNVCNVRTVSGFSSRALGYDSPCRSGQFVVRQADGRKFTYPPKADPESEGPRIERLFVLDGRLVYTIRSESSTALWIVYASKPMEAVLMGELPPSSVESVSASPSGLALIARMDADNTRSLISVQANVQRDEFRFHTEHEGIADMRVFDDTMAIVKGSTLTLLAAGGRELMPPARGVRGNFNFVFDGEAAALAYVSDVDDDTGLGQLKLQFLSGPHFDIARDVREFRDVWWPEPGLLFTTGGDGAGISFASVDVPCEMTSDAPWACGF